MKLLKTALWTSAALIGLALIVTAPASADQVILDDLIVDGSICVGQDCVNGESFGFDTLRLKENNLRIKFEDTSTSASFPSNDWQLTANDSSNGGANKFSVDDITGGRTPFTIEASAPSHSLFVDSSGKIGFGTSTPVVDLHVKSGNTPTLRLEQDGSSGFTAQTWDVAGNEANFFIRDATNGSTLPFRIQPGASSNVIYVASDDEVGFGTTSPDASLHVVGGGVLIDSDTDSGAGVANANLHVRGDGTQILRVESADANNPAINLVNPSVTWRLLNNSAQGGRFEIQYGAGVTPFKVEEDASGNLLTLTGGVVQVLGTQVHPDYVFEADYELESIQDHAAYMWEKKHLPAVGAGTYNENGEPVILLGSQTAGMLEELEKAHIYIEQLHQQLGALTERLDALGQQE